MYNVKVSGKAAGCIRQQNVKTHIVKKAAGIGARQARAVVVCARVGRQPGVLRGTMRGRHTWATNGAKACCGRRAR